ncbi:branched-chain amino acid ABC transporter permease [Aquibacillus saliphilus]|uniref:branched-chain amino acid ABC transporter permease n=1 Tax=Aquibacillus saliphilus TaxID=1909422 RepID=UPI001CF09D91|nr:branched-chain amino acid ABC transporter permease [Aquibacillus saliphilus]
MKVAISKQPVRWITVIIVLMIFLLPTYMDNPYYLRLIQMIAIFSLLGLGLNFLFGYTGQISLGHAAFYAMGAYVSVILETIVGMHFLLAWIVTILFTIVVAVIVSLPILKLKGHYLAMATIAFGLIIETFLVQWRSLTGGHDGTFIMPETILGPWLAENIYYLIVGSVIISFMLLRNLTRSSIGRVHMALRDDEDAAEALGVNVLKHKVFAFALSAALAAIAGIWYAHYSMVITPEVFGVHTSIQILMLIVIGGLASNLGSILGAAFLILVPELLQEFQDATVFIYGLIVLAVLIFFPKGLAGIVQLVIRFFKKFLFSHDKDSEKGSFKDVS